MPPVAKPAARRQRRNRPALVSLPTTPVNVPEPPSGLLRATVAAWDELWASPVAATFLPSDMPALARVFELRDEWTRVTRVARKQRLTEGHKQQPVLNPLLRYAETLAAEVRALEDRYGLSPRSRLQLGIAFGEAHRSLDALNAEFMERTDDDDG